MAAAPNQLDEIYKQVRDCFVSHPVISVRPTKGNPPDQYEITYTLTGLCKNGTGKVDESTNHLVELVIPFGFPHFPPSCKPKSDIFHPDFDPAAVCLGDFWTQDRSLSDLIIHIGRMINGEIFSTANSFNEEAAEWYQSNPDKFPLTAIQWETATSPDVAPSSPSSLHEIDTLDETDLATEYDFLSMEDKGNDEEITLNTSFPEVGSSKAVDLQFLKLLESQKKYYTLLKNSEGNGHTSNEVRNLYQIAKDNVRKVEQLHREAKKFENSGNAKNAFEKYQQIAAQVTDFPSIESDLHRIKQTLALLDDILPDSAPDEIIGEPATPENRSGNKVTKKNDRKTQTETPKTLRGLSSSEQRKSNNIGLFLVLGLLVVGAACGGYFWYSFTQKLNDAEIAYNRCTASCENNQFDAAKSSCDTALQLVSGVKFIHQNHARQLEKSIEELLHSEKFTQGLAGNLFFAGKYVPKNEATTLQSIQQKIDGAGTLFKEEKWLSAAKLYRTLLAQIGDNAYLDRSIVEEINRKLLISEFRLSYDPAQVMMQKGQWDNAIEKLLQAQKILVSLPESDREQYSEKLQSALQKSQFANLKEQGDQSFTGSDWLSAIASYNKALASGQKNSLPPESIEAIRNNIKRAEIYTVINRGNKAFAAGSWNEAIEAYSKASELLSGKRGVPTDTDSNANIRKLSRIILQASIIRDRQTVQTMLEKKDLAKAKHAYQQILAAIASSPFKTEKEFISTTGEIGSAIQSLDEKIYLMQKVDYLTDNYQSLFIANYPSATPETLTNPVIAKSKETDAKLVFRMQCTENDGGRPLTLVMFYAYDKKTGKWHLYSEN